MKKEFSLKDYKRVGKAGKIEWIAPKKHKGIYLCEWKVTFPFGEIIVLKVTKANDKQMTFKILNQMKAKK